MIKNKRIVYFISIVVIIISVVSVSVFASGSEIDTAISAPGGTVRSGAQLIAALGGPSAASLDDDTVTLKSDVKLTAPLVIASGSYKINGAGCSIIRDFKTGNLITVGGDGADASLDLGLATYTSNTPSLIIDGSFAKFNTDGSALKIESGAYVTVYNGTVFMDILSSSQGGAINNYGSLSISSATFENCASSSDGGAIYNTGILNIASAVITGCKGADGGAIHNRGILNIAGIDISKCKATNDGGAIYAGGQSEISSAKITECDAQNGGAIANAGTLNIKDTTISGCRAEIFGGGIYNEETVIHESAEIEECTAKNGAGVYNIGEYTLSDGYICANESTDNGAGIYNIGTFSVLGGNIWRNKTDAAGGGAFNEGTFLVSAGEIIGNMASAGSGICNKGSLVFSSGAYVGKENDIAIVTSGDTTYTVTAKGDLKVNLVAVLTPAREEKGKIVPSFEKGFKVLNFDSETDADTAAKFTLSDSNDKYNWIISEDGSITNKQPLYKIWWLSFLIIGILFLVIVITGITLKIKINKKKEPSNDKQEQTESQTDSGDSAGSEK